MTLRTFSYAGLLPRDKDGWDVSAVRQRNGNINIYRHGPEGDDHWGIMQKLAKDGDFSFRSVHEDTQPSNGFQGDEAGLFAAVVRSCGGSLPTWAESDNLKQTEIEVGSVTLELNREGNGHSWFKRIRSGVDSAYESTLAWSNSLTLPVSLKPYKSYIEKGLFLVAIDIVAKHYTDEETLALLARKIQALLPQPLQYVMSEERLLRNLQYLKGGLLERVNSYRASIEQVADQNNRSDEPLSEHSSAT